MIEFNFDDFFITSDTWFGRNNILNIANRPFASVEEMDHQLVEKWNNRVKPNDVVLHLGNFAWDTISASKALKNLNGKIYFILGNIDEILLNVAPEFKNKIQIFVDQILQLNHVDSIMSHYPLLDWAGRETGTLHFHGHSIYSNKTDLRASKRFNMCCDYWSYAPVKYSTLKEIADEEN